VDRDTSLLSVLKADARRLTVLTDYLSYPHSTAIQVEALRLTKLLAERLPNLVDFLSRGSSPRTLRLDDLQSVRAVRAATALEASLFRSPEDPATSDDVKHPLTALVHVLRVIFVTVIARGLTGL
jgi:hypothetical protein